MKYLKGGAARAEQNSDDPLPSVRTAAHAVSFGRRSQPGFGEFATGRHE